MASAVPQITVVLNPTAGGGRSERLLPEIAASLDSLGLQFEVERSESIDHARQVASTAAAAGRVVASVGGDGMAGAVAGGVAQHGGTLALIPGGRGNDFARALEIPNEVERACAVIARGKTRKIDLGVAGGTPFCCIASAGFDSRANELANSARVIRGNLVYLYAALRALATWKPVKFELELDGKPLTYTGYTVAIANTAYYGGGMKVAPDAQPDDGMLEVVMIGEASKRRFLMNFRHVFRGTHIELVPAVRVERAREVLIKNITPLDVYADGDKIVSTPATVGVLPGAISVLVP